MSALLKKPRKWVFSPGLVAPEWEWFHKNLVGGFIFWEGAAEPFELGTGKKATFSSVPLWKPTPHGMSLFVDGLNDHCEGEANSKLLSLQPPLTICSYVIADVLEYGAFICNNSGRANYSGAWLGHWSTAGQIWFGFGDDAGLGSSNRGGWISTSTGLLVVGEANTIVGSMHSLASADVYLNGFPVALTASGTATTMVNSDGQPNIGWLRDVFGLGHRNMISCIFDTDWTSAQAEQWSRDSFGPFRMADEIPVILVTVQMAFPSADISLGGWTPSAGGSPTELWPMIDEATPDDSDYIQSVLTPSNDTCEVRLQVLGDPAVSTGHVVRYRYSKSFAAGRVDLTVKLMDGGIEIASFTHSDISTTDTQADQTLSAAQADSISDYGDLRLRFSANQP